MTIKEFDAEYIKLKSCYPQIFDNEFKERAICVSVKDLDHSWWRALVHRILSSSNPRIDIGDAARGERIARKRIQETNNLIHASDRFKEQVTEKGLANVLGPLGVSSAWDAVKKQRGDKDEDSERGLGSGEEGV